MSQAFCKKHFKVVQKNQKNGNNETSEVKKQVSESIRPSPIRRPSSTQDDDDDLFDKEADYSDDNEVSTSPKRPPKKKARTNDQSNQNSEYFQKKRRIEKHSADMLREFEMTLQAGKPVDKGLEHVLKHWKGALAPSDYHLCIDQTRPGIIKLSNKYRDEEPARPAPQKKNMELRRPNNRWTNLFVPNFVGSIFNPEWDKIEEISESEMEY